MGATPASEDALLAAAAGGNSEAQHALMLHALYDFPDVEFSERLCAAEMFARLAATHGGSRERAALAGVLLLRADTVGEQPRSQVFIAEATAILTQLADEGVEDAGATLVGLLSQLADDGDEIAADGLNRAVEKYGASAAIRARELIEKIKGDCSDRG